MADDTLETLDVDISDLTIAEVVEIEEKMEGF